MRNTDLGNGERFFAQHKRTARWVEKWGRWIVWDGKRYRVDESREISRLAQETALSIYAETQNASSEKERGEIARWGIKSESRERQEAMLWAAKPALNVDSNELDADPWKINLANGTLNLRTMKLAKHDPADLITRLAPVDYDPDAACPKWTAFLDYLLAGDMDVINYLQRMAGYCLTGSVDEHALFFFLGGGRNGKSTFREALRRVWGDYATTIDVEALLMSFGDPKAATPNIARLQGARMVLASELPQDRRLNESLVKAITGGEAIVARFLRSNPVEFMPTHKLILAGQHKPAVIGGDLGIWRRLKVIPWPVTIPEDRVRPMTELIGEFMAEAPGILAWAIEGCAIWQANGMQVPRVVSEAIEAYKAEQDMLAEFMAESLELHPDYSAPKASVYAAFKNFAEDDPDLKRRGKIWLTRQLAARGINGDDRNVYHGIRLNGAKLL